MFNKCYVYDKGYDKGVKGFLNYPFLKLKWIQRKLQSKGNMVVLWSKTNAKECKRMQKNAKECKEIEVQCQNHALFCLFSERRYSLLEEIVRRKNQHFSGL